MNCNETLPLRLPRTAVALSILVLLAVSNPPAAAQFPPERLENLQVLPEETDVRELIGLMRSFSMALGVRCQHCHAGDPQAPMAETDFQSDEKQAKRTARTMMRMTRTINDTHLADVESSGASRLVVECVTCHRGQSRPATLAEVLTAELESGGVDAAVARYRALRSEFYGGHSFDFTEWTLIMLGDTLIDRGRGEAAEAMLQLNLEFFPESTASWDFLAELYRREGRLEDARDAIRRALAIDPDDRRAKQILSTIEEGNGGD